MRILFVLPTLSQADQRIREMRLETNVSIAPLISSGRNEAERTVERFVTLGTGLFGFDKSLPDMEMAQKVIDAFYKFFESIGIPMHLGELGVKAEAIDEMADHILENDSTNEPWMYAPIGKDALIRILNASM